MNDTIFRSFLERQKETGLALAAESDLLELSPEPVEFPQRYIAVFSCTGLVKVGPGEPQKADRFVFGIHLPDHYLRRVDAMRCITALEPVPGIWHPNIMMTAVCPGKLVPGMGIDELLYQLFEMITYHRYAADDSLNPQAAQWARNQDPASFPVDRRPLKRPGGGADSAPGDDGRKGGASC